MKSTLLWLLFPVMLIAKSYLISNIPLPKSYILNLDTQECNETCLQEYLQHGAIFSFLAHARQNLDDPRLNETRLLYISLFNLDNTKRGDKLKIAILLPYKKIGRYANSTTNALFAYLLAQNIDYELKSFPIEDESGEAIAEALRQMEQEGYNYLIAPLTKKGAVELVLCRNTLHTYIPTVNKEDLNTTDENIYFGGISYQSQIDRLMEYATDPLVIFYDKSSPLADELKNKTIQSYLERNTANENARYYTYGIEKRHSNLKGYLKDNPRINEATFFLDTSIVKSSMIMSQLTLYDINASAILSTQISYNPLLFSMTQYKDRKHMLIANSITHNNLIITETNNLLNNNIGFDWINYATTVGIDIFYNLQTGNAREYPLRLIDRQVRYPIEIVRPKRSKFLRIDKL